MTNGPLNLIRILGNTNINDIMLQARKLSLGKKCIIIIKDTVSSFHEQCVAKSSKKELQNIKYNDIFITKKKKITKSVYITCIKKV